LRRAPDLEAERDVARDAQVLERRVVLEHEAHVAASCGQVRRVTTLDLDLAGVGHLEPGDDAQERRLAAPARAEQRREAAGRDGHGDVVERDEVAEGLADVADLDAHASASEGTAGRVAGRAGRRAGAASSDRRRVTATMHATDTDARRNATAYAVTCSKSWWRCSTRSVEVWVRPSKLPDTTLTAP